MKFFNLILSLALLVLTLSCKTQKTKELEVPQPTELYKKFRNSVVLIQNSYYFKSVTDNESEFFYTVVNDEPILHNNEDEALQNATTTFGTGFIISKYGEIATNSHVIFPSRNDELIGRKISEYMSDIKLKILKSINEIESELLNISNKYNQLPGDGELQIKAALNEEFLQKQNEKLELESLLAKLDFNPKNTKTELIRVFLGVAFDDTYVTAQSDFKECVPVKKSNNQSIDLAIIQLKDKIIPPTITNFFSIDSLDTIRKISLNENVFMIGFNYGLSMANTENGIKSQFTQGTITQEPDNNKILYSIPTLPGSSGSPIIDKWGNLVAINFAKTSEFQGFSFGIPSNNLKDLYNLPNSISQSEFKISNAIKSSNPKIKINNKLMTTIRYFIKAEEDRNFEEIFSFFSSNMTRYYDLKHPSHDKLKLRYEYFWDFTSDAHNDIHSIDKINDYIYDLHTTYTFYNHRKETNVEVNATVRFIFDSNGKIIEMYGI